LYAASDAAAQTTLPVVDEPSLRNAIRTVSAAFAQGTAGGPYTIDLQGDITLTRSLPSVRTESPGDGSAWVTIHGNTHQIDANQTGRVFVIASGIVSIDNLHIVDARARGGKGGDSHRGGTGGGGLGAGAAIFVNAGAVLHTTSVTIENADAIGGNGGAVVTQPNPDITAGGGGGGGLNGDGGMTSSASISPHNGRGGGGGGGYLGTGGANTSTTQGAGGGGGGGEEGAGGAVRAHGGGGGGGAAGPGGEAWEFGGGGGGGKTAAGDTNDGPFAAAGGVEGGQRRARTRRQ
jgi:fibronectin-binding autotransporter adhesin